MKKRAASILTLIMSIVMLISSIGLTGCGALNNNEAA